MKNKLLSLISLAAFLVGCNNTAGKTDLTIVSPTGAPALAFYDYANASNFETNAVPTNIVAMMSASQKDVVVLPTNAGMQAIIKQNSAPYKIAATITFGNFYIVSMGNDDNNVMDAGDQILLFQQNNVPDKLFHYVYGNDLDAGIHYANAVSDASAAVIAGSFVDGDQTIVPNYVLLAEPVLTTVLNKKQTVSVYADIQEKYKEKSGNKEIFQASVFVNDRTDKDKVRTFLSSLEEDIEAAIKDPSKLSKGMNKAGDSAQEIFGVAPAMAEAVMKKNNGMGLGFKYAKDNKEAIANFLGLFNINEVPESVYFE